MDLKERIEQAKNIVFFGGAGVSTESGIPDFRSDNGLYKRNIDTRQNVWFLTASLCRIPRSFMSFTLIR